MFIRNLIKQDTRDVAVGVAVTVFLFTVSAFFPIVGFIAALFLPLPTAIYRVKLGRAAGALVPVISVVVMALILGKGLDSLLFFGGLLIVGLIIGEVICTKRPVEWAFIWSATAVLLLSAVLIFAAAAGSDTGVTALVTGYVEQNLSLSLKLYEAMGAQEASIQLFKEELSGIRYILVRVLPGLLAMFIFMITWINLLAARRILLAKGMPASTISPLRLWRAPDRLVWGAIACGAAVFTLPMGVIKLIGMNGLIVLLTVYFFQGMAVVAFFVDKKKLPKMMRWVIYAMIALQQVLALMVIGLGFFDIWVNFRKIDRQTAG